MNDFFKHVFTETAFNLLRYFVIAGIMFYLFYKLLTHKVTKNKIQPTKFAQKKDFFREILHSSMSTFILAGMAILAFTPWVKPHTFIYTNLNDYPIWWIPVSVGLALVIHDTYFYWMHRTLHHPKLFNLTHLLHHKSTNPSPWTAYSFHALEAVAEGGVVLVLVFVMPMHPLSLALFNIAALIINVYGHLGYEIMPKGFRKSFLFEILNSSTYHNLHHAKFKGNYSLYFRIWDRVMGTEHPDYVKIYDAIQERRFGKTS
ncbi:Sterol desaturase/sphingolipid hydroxylase, fatty acid hydroxylase superfamily [Chitinophaga jiangningensis]|uniref:Sterol desaturase/sphingolipid hydroxylase, fatty acid hydroxylase superfamily n=1 Tax=Chitinophaga jiangningensis TaxID=1419482 RepID=A0A1M6V980_9BACT|nr:sterol desaturase family protein [Chitinophaga jiangningensis]SHK77914.1 Sterol desaturase/sphingolipid hydroxylase, fatty acid hydroxylase superfamily [Chitinophaga jiangningensis]